MSNNLRSAVRLAVATDNHIPETAAAHRPSELFGRDVFGMEAMRERLPAQVFKRLEPVPYTHLTLPTKEMA